jgi:ElaB/YqjD/DUF883 family membrane-anchored ribosome-binding protein
VSDPEDTEDPASAIAQTVSGTVDKVSDVASHAAETAQGVAREAGRQARAVSQSTYGQSGDLIDVIEDTIRGNPISTVLVAAAIGYGIARLSHHRRRSHCRTLSNKKGRPEERPGSHVHAAV